MRGKVENIKKRIIAAGITPAYAGKRNNEKRNKKSKWDHPRVCGEKTKKIP